MQARIIEVMISGHDDTLLSMDDEDGELGVSFDDNAVHVSRIEAGVGSNWWFPWSQVAEVFVAEEMPGDAHVVPVRPVNQVSSRVADLPPPAP